MKERKRKMSGSHMRLKGKESGTTSVNGHHNKDLRASGSRGASRGSLLQGNLAGVKSRLSQSGINNQIASA